MTDRTLPPNARMIPPQAEKVFSGVIFDVFQWQQEMFDGSIETYEMLRRPDTVIIFAVLDDDRIVVLDEQQPSGLERHNRLPAGRVDPDDESVLAAAQRELKEETGMVFSQWDLIEVNQPEAKIEWFVHVFLARQKTGQFEPATDPGEKIMVKTADFATVKNKEMRGIVSLKNVDSLASFLSSIDARQ